MPVFKLLKMCGECPFRKAALPGWLGPWRAEELDGLANSDETFICHVSIDQMIKKGVSAEEEHEERGQHCVGILRYRNGMCKSNRDRVVDNEQRKLREVPDKPVIEPRQFLAHHQQDLADFVKTVEVGK